MNDVRPRADRPQIDVDRLRRDRLDRLQTMMRRHELPACLFFNGANIRYATGAGSLCVWAESAFARYAIVPAEGTPILFESESSAHISRRVVADVRPAHYWYMEGSRPGLGCQRALGIGRAGARGRAAGR
jgi:Xaa-Pro aminopeptidase